jgi:hypothetical protein
MLDLSGNCKPVVLCLNWAIPRGSATAAFVESWYAPCSNHSLHVSECRVDADVVCSNHCGGILHDVSPPVECCIAPAECCIDAAVVNSPSTDSLLMGSIPNSTECLFDAAADSAGEVLQDSSPLVECCIAPVECCFDAAVVNSCIPPVECRIDAAVVNSPGTVSLLVGSMRNSSECPVDAAVVSAGEVSHDSSPPVECCIASVECCFDAAVVNSLEAFSGAADVNVSEVDPPPSECRADAAGTPDPVRCLVDATNETVQAPVYVCTGTPPRNELPSRWLDIASKYLNAFELSCYVLDRMDELHCLQHARFGNGFETDLAFRVCAHFLRLGSAREIVLREPAGTLLALCHLNGEAQVWHALDGAQAAGLDRVALFASLAEALASTAWNQLAPVPELVRSACLMWKLPAA